MKKTIITIVIILGIVIIGYLVAPKPPAPTLDEIFGAPKMANHLKLKASKDKIFGAWDVDWIQVEEDGTRVNRGKIKQYKYNSGVEVLPVEGEDISKRTINAQFFKDEIFGGENGEEKWTGKFYGGTPFYKDNNEKWYQVETATTSIKAWNSQMKISWWREIVPAFAASPLTTQSEPDGEGLCTHYINTGATWATIREAAESEAVSTGITNHNTFANSGDHAAIGFLIQRGFTPFLTSELPDDATITSASAWVYVTNVVNNDNDGNDWVNIASTSQASTTALATTDYNECGPLTPSADNWMSDDEKDITGIGINKYHDWLFNSEGIAAISKTDWTKIGWRAGFDAINHEPGGGENSMWGRFSNYTGTDYDPYIKIEYTEAAPAEEDEFPVMKIK